MLITHAVELVFFFGSGYHSLAQGEGHINNLVEAIRELVDNGHVQFEVLGECKLSLQDVVSWKSSIHDMTREAVLDTITS